jgi:hypothetical protein
MNLKFYTGVEHDQWIATLAIGDSYLKCYERYVLPFALDYCKRNRLGLVALVGDADSNYPEAVSLKKKNWQKLLIPTALCTHLGKEVEVAYYDADVLLNPYGKNVFCFSNKASLGLTKQSSGAPYDDHLSKRIISFYRNKYYSDSYPLDSSIFMSTEEIYRYHNLPVHDDYSCTGFFVSHDSTTAHKLSQIYELYDCSVGGLTDGGDEPFLNHEFRNRFQICYLDYEFQAIWTWEMASRYRHLFLNPEPTQESSNCISSALLSVTALHFAGSWPDAQLYKDEFIYAKVGASANKEFFDYLNKPVWGVPKGRKSMPS